MKKRHRIALPILVLLLTTLMIIYSDTATEKALTTLKNSAHQIIPALFPYMVMSSLIVTSGAADILGKILPLSYIFKLPECATAPIILGALCGFPLGAKSAAELYQNGYITKCEAEVLISIANNTGPTFLIFVVGTAIWKETRFGIFLYISQLLSSVVASLTVNNIIFPIKVKDHSISPVIVIKPFITSFADAIRNAALSSLQVCGFITFFSVFSSLLYEILYFIPHRIMYFATALLEFSEASSLSASIGGAYGAFICGFAIGWSGLSVFCQTAAFTNPLQLSLKRCFVVKLIQGLLLGISSVCYSKTNGFNLNTECFTPIENYRIVPIIAIGFVFLIIYMINLIKKRKYA